MTLLTIKQAALKLNLHPKSVRAAINRGDLPVIRMLESARSDRIDPEDLERFKRGRRVCLSTNGGADTISISTSTGAESDDLLARRLARKTL